MLDFFGMEKKGHYNECINFLSSDLFSSCKAMVLAMIKTFLAVEHSKGALLFIGKYKVDYHKNLDVFAIHKHRSTSLIFHMFIYTTDAF